MLQDFRGNLFGRGLDRIRKTLVVTGPEYIMVMKRVSSFKVWDTI